MTPWSLHGPVASSTEPDVNMLLEKSREIAQERMKRLSQSENNTQLWV